MAAAVPLLCDTTYHRAKYLGVFRNHVAGESRKNHLLVFRGGPLCETSFNTTGGGENATAQDKRCNFRSEPLATFRGELTPLGVLDTLYSTKSMGVPLYSRSYPCWMIPGPTKSSYAFYLRLNVAATRGHSAHSDTT